MPPPVLLFRHFSSINRHPCFLDKVFSLWSFLLSFRLLKALDRSLLFGRPHLLYGSVASHLWQSLKHPSRLTSEQGSLIRTHFEWKVQATLDLCKVGPGIKSSYISVYTNKRALHVHRRSRIRPVNEYRESAPDFTVKTELSKQVNLEYSIIFLRELGHYSLLFSWFVLPKEKKDIKMDASCSYYFPQRSPILHTNKDTGIKTPTLSTYI